MPRVVQVSTDEVYGSIIDGLLDRGRPAGAESPYSAAKAGVTYGPGLRPHLRAQRLITRGWNNYGPYQYPEKVIPLFITNPLDGKPVPLYGDGRQVRDWIHVDDHCRGIQLAPERGQAGRSTTSAATRSVEPGDHPGLARCAAGRAGTRGARRGPQEPRPRYSLDGSRPAHGYLPGVSADGLAATVGGTRITGPGGSR